MGGEGYTPREASRPRVQLDGDRKRVEDYHHRDADVYGVNASDIVREVEETRREARRERAAVIIANTPPVE